MTAASAIASDLARAAETGQRAGSPLLPDPRAAIERARAVLSPSGGERQVPAYPTHALGPLAAACKAIAEHGQVQPAMAGQCLLGAASLLVQGLANVESLNGPRPLALYLLTLGDSGDGKSSAQRPALAPVTEWQREAAVRHREALADFEREKAGRKKGDPPADAPASPYRLVADATVEGLRRELETGPVAQGLFTDEAAAILAGYGMSAEHRAKTAAVFSKIWDSGHLSVSRAGGGRTERYGCRLAMHWLIQPEAACDTLGDSMLTSLGFWPRFLVAWPAPLAPRVARQFKPETLPAVLQFWSRCAELLAEPLPADADGCVQLPLTDGARSLLSAAFDRFEVLARRGALKPIKPFALRAAEQAARVAGVLTCFAGSNAVSEETMRGALALVAHSLEAWRVLIDEGTVDDATGRALRLYEWLVARPGWTESLATIVNRGPAQVRSKDRRDAALDLLADAGLVAKFDGRVMALMADDQGGRHGN